jgi:hypothetical protein
MIERAGAQEMTPSYAPSLYVVSNLNYIQHWRVAFLKARGI